MTKVFCFPENVVFIYSHLYHFKNQITFVFVNIRLSCSTLTVH